MGCQLFFRCVCTRARVESIVHSHAGGGDDCSIPFSLPIYQRRQPLPSFSPLKPCITLRLASFSVSVPHFFTISRTSSSLGLHRPRSSTSTSDAMAGLISPSPVSFLQGGGTGGGGGTAQQQQYNLNVGVNQVLPQVYQQQRAGGTLSLGGGLGGSIGGVGGTSVNLPYSDTQSLPAHLSHQQVNQYMNALQGGGFSLPVGVGVTGLGGIGLSAGSVGGIAGVNPGHEEGKLFSLVIDLMDPNTRETALLDLSKKREQYDDLAMVLWHSFGAHFLSLLQLGSRGINCRSVDRNHARVASRDCLRLPLAFTSKFDCSCI